MTSYVPTGSGQLQKIEPKHINGTGMPIIGVRHEPDDAPELPFGQPARPLKTERAEPEIHIAPTDCGSKPRTKKKVPAGWPTDADELRAVTELIEMHTWKRPHSTKAERKFIRRYILPLGVEVDGFGNCWKMVMDKDAAGGPVPPTIMWSAHTDTVHYRPGRQKISIRGNWLKLHSKERANCLGADNSAGVWLLREMILKGVPGLYVFHRQEEIGSNGAKHFLEHNKVLLDGIESAIAFDRKADWSIITFQRSRRTCSDAFAASLASVLGLGHKADPDGSFTDTAYYAEDIAECTNVSVGFRNAHTSGEELDLLYVRKLRKALLAADFSQLVIARNPKVVEHRYGYGSHHGGGYRTFQSNTQTHEWDYGHWEGGHYVKPEPKHHTYQGSYQGAHAPASAYGVQPQHTASVLALPDYRKNKGKVADRIPAISKSGKKKSSWSRGIAAVARAVGVPATGRAPPRGFLSEGATPDYDPDLRIQMTVLAVINAYPVEVADYLESAGTTAQELMDYINQLHP